MLCERCQEPIERPVLDPQVFDPDRRSILLPSGGFRRLNPTQWQIAEILFRRKHRLTTTESLYTLLWGHRLNPPQPQTLRVHVTLLRQALEATPYQIESIYGAGYRLIDRRAEVKAPAPLTLAQKIARHARALADEAGRSL